MRVLYLIKFDVIITHVHCFCCLCCCTQPATPLWQVEYLLRGLFARACRSLGGVPEPVDQIRAETRQLRELLSEKLGQINTNLEGVAPLVQPPIVSFKQSASLCACKIEIWYEHLPF
jgi:hypothetical protein